MKWLAIVILALAAMPVHAQDRPPNVVLILVDDMGWMDLGCQGSDFHETPNIDRLARQGVRFTNAYAAAAVCSPTRAAIMTGKYPARLRITDWIPGVKYPHAEVLGPLFHQEVAHAEVTLAEALRASGYATLHVGKWHLGSEPFYPKAQGFDVNVAGHSKGAPATYFHPYQATKPGRADWSVRNMPPGGKDGDYLTDRLTDEAIALIRARRDEPFFLHLSYYAVHTPIEGKPDLVERYRAKKSPLREQHHAVYAAMVHALDENVGRVMAALHNFGLDDDTIVIFTSDNGGVANITSNAPLRAGKGFLYEGGIRVPMIVRWPGTVAPRTTCDTPVSSIDLYPTILAMTGVPGDPIHDEEVDGVSLVPLLANPAHDLGREALYWHYPHYHTPKRPPTGAVRTGRWKLLETYADGRVELYDVEADPGERNDLAGEDPARAAVLRAKLHAWLDAVDAQRVRPNPDHDPEKPFRGGYADWGAVTPGS
jgi:arylsulfatase A-like enzyme